MSTIDAPAEVSEGLTAVIRAHGVTPEVQRELEERADRVIDATCPFVTKVQKLAERAAREGRDVVVVGNPDHPEMIGVVGYAPGHSHVVRDASEVASCRRCRAARLRNDLEAKTSSSGRRPCAEGDWSRRSQTICSSTRAGRRVALARVHVVLLRHGGKHSRTRLNSIGLQGAVREDFSSDSRR